jgi:hypothetical protein
MITTLAAKLFVDPLAIERYWPLFGVFLMLMVGIGYKAITTPDPAQVPRRAAWFLFKSTGLMLLLGFAAWLITARN